MTELLPISLVAEHVFCPRAAWLSHAAGAFQANEFTVDGELLHARVHRGGASTQRGRRQWRRVAVGSSQLGVVGYIDLVEEDGERLVVVEYKRGPMRERRSDMVQVCLQALCLEEMTGRDVPSAAVYYAGSRRRVSIVLDPPLRREARHAVQSLRESLTSPAPPSAQPGPRCRGCAATLGCLPDANEVLRRFDWREWIR